MFGYECKVVLYSDSVVQGYRTEDGGRKAWRGGEPWLGLEVGRERDSVKQLKIEDKGKRNVGQTTCRISMPVLYIYLVRQTTLGDAAFKMPDLFLCSP